MSGYAEKAAFITGAEGTRPKFGHTFADTDAVLGIIPTEWKGRRVRWTATKPVDVTTEALVTLLFGTSAAIVVDPDAESGGTLPDWETNAAIGDKLVANGGSLDIYIEHQFTHFSAQCDTADITLTGIVSDLEAVAPSIISGRVPSTGG